MLCTLCYRSLVIVLYSRSLATVCPVLTMHVMMGCGMQEAAMSLGATATGLLTLRMVDPENKTILLKAFCTRTLSYQAP